VREVFDLYTREIDADPFAAYGHLRDEHPCYWSDKAGLWILSRYDDVARAATDWEVYSSTGGNLIDDIPGGVGGTLGATDPPRHDRLRALVNAAFAKKNLSHMVALSRTVAARALADIAEKQAFDFVADFSSVVTVETLFTMLGLAARDPTEIRREVVLAISSDKDLCGRNDQQNAAFQRLEQFLADEVAQRRKTPSDDLITRLTEAKIDGDRLDDREVVLTISMFVMAGVEPLSSFMSNFALNLADFPDVRRRIARDPTLMPQAIEESLRFNTSAQRFKRTLTRDVTLHGQTMKAGDSVVLAYGAANRDDRKFPHADRFDLDRAPVGHLGFGVGPHFCIGNSLARLVTQTTMNMFLAAIPDFTLVRRDFDWLQSSNFRSPMELPLRIGA